MKDLIIIGAGGLGREALTIAKDILSVKPDTGWRVKGFLTDIVGDFYEKDTGGYEILGPITGHSVSENNVYVFAIADIAFKKKATEELIKKGAQFINLINPYVSVPPSCNLGVGNIIQGGVGVSVDVNIGNFNMINAYTTIGHDAIIGNCCTIGPACAISGYCHLEDGVFLGAHSVLYPHAKVGAYARVGAASVVIKKVKPGTFVIGNPAVQV